MPEGRGSFYAVSMPLPPPVPALPARLVTGAGLLPNRAAILPLLPKRGVVAEVGVGLGGFTAQMLASCDPARFIAIDQFRLHEIPMLWGRTSAEHFGTQSHRDWYCARFAGALAEGRMQVMEGDSPEMLARLDDASVDVFYVDGDHSYAGVTRDLAMVARKVKPDGYVIMNDYVLVDQLMAEHAYGVIYATHEFMLQHGWSMQYFVLQTNMFCDVVLRKAGLVSPTADRLAALEQENALLRQEVRLLRESRSWRVTAPLRGLVRALGRRK